MLLIGLILILVVGRQSRDLSVLLSLAVCVLVCLGAVEFLEPVIQLLRQLRRLGALDSDAVSILLKCALIELTADLAGVICTDAGEGALAGALRLLSNGVILWLSIPLLQQIIDLIGEVLAKL